MPPREGGCALRAILPSHTLLPGACLWFDFTHWYFAIYIKPAAPPSQFIHIRKESWLRAVDRRGWHWGISEGSLPRCCLSTLWVITMEPACGRTLQGPTMQRLIDFMGHVWAASGWSGQLRLENNNPQQGILVEVECGMVNAHVVVQAIVPTPATQKQILGALEKCCANSKCCLLSTLAICARRACRLSSHSSEEVWVQYFAQMEFHCVRVMEDYFIRG